MYCRECGIQLNQNAKYCHACGCDVVLIEQEQIKPNQTKEVKDKSKIIPNPYVNAGALIAAAGLVLSLFPWPREWGVGTSYWMLGAILILGLISYQLHRKATAFNRQLLEQYVDSSKNGLLKFTKIASTLTIVLSAITIVSKFNFF